MRLPSKDSATWKGLITAFQTFLTFLVAAAASPQVMAIITDYYPWFVPVISAGAGVAAFVLGLLRKSVKNY